MARTRASLFVRYGAAILVTALCTALRVLLDPFLGEHLPYLTFFAGVALVAWFAGTSPGVLALLLSVLSSAYFFVPPRGSWRVDQPGYETGLVVFLAVNVFILGLIHTVHSARRRAQKSAEEASRSREWLGVTLASIGDGVIASDVKSRIRYLNPVAEALTGRFLKEAEGHFVDEVLCLVDPRNGEPIESPVILALREGKSVRLADPISLRTRGGADRVIEVNAAPITDPRGEIAGVVLVCRDNTDARLAQEKLRQSEQELSDFFDNAAIGLHCVGPDGKIVRVNQAELDMLGYTSDEYLGHSISEFHVDPDRIRDILDRLARGETLRNFDARLRCKNGSVKDVLIAANALSRDGIFVHSRCFTRDVTELKAFQQALAHSIERLELALGAGSMGAWDWSLSSNEMKWSPGLEALHGWAHGQFPGTFEAFQEEIHPDDRERVLRSLRQAIEAGREYHAEYRMVRPDGQIRWLEARGKLFIDESKQPVRMLGVCADITDRKQAEETARFLAGASAALAGLVDYESTLQNVARLAVPFFADWCAVDLVQSNGRLRRLAITHVDPGKIALAGRISERYPPDPNADYGPYHVLRTGKSEMMAEIPDSLRVQLARDEEHLDLMRQIGLKSYLSVPLVSPDRLLGVMSFALSESARQYTARDLAVAEDLAHRASVAIENARLYRAVQDAARRKDEFLAMLAHELRNPLAPIRNALQVLKTPGATTAMLEDVRDMAERQVHHLTRLVDDLLDISRIMRGKIELRKEQVQLENIVAQAVETADGAMREREHCLQVSVPAEPIWVKADPVRMSQVIANLLLNAAKYTEPNGHIWLTVGRQANEAIIHVRDTGIGIAPEILPNIFDAFVQGNNPVGQSQGGMGIGLTLVRRLTQMHGGSVQVSSDGPGQGSEFTVSLPISSALTGAQPKLPDEPESIAAEKPPKRRILVVDDNEDAARSLGTLLRLQGQEVRVTFDGPSALQAAQNSRPDLVFLDIGMPGMDGYEVARRFRADPALEKCRLIALTGWGQDEDRRRSNQAGFDQHLVKPVELCDLQELLNCDS